MKKILTLNLILLFCICINDTKAQESSLGASISRGLTFLKSKITVDNSQGGVSLGMFKGFTNSDAQFGFNISDKYDINEKIRIGANFGYYFKSYDFFGSTLRAFSMPITGLFEYSFNDSDFSPYAGADIGIYRFGFSGGGTTLARATFGLAPLVGFNYKLSDKLLLNGNLKCHFIMSTGESLSALGINAGICYKF